MDRRQRVLDLVKPRGRRGVEIGPLANPLILRGDGDVLYADHLPTEGLRRKYRGHPGLGAEGTDAIVPVDVVLDGCTLAEALGARAPVDYVVASHVLEHIPDPVGWLREAAEGLREGGMVCLLVPDRRFTFDHFRRDSTPGEIVAAHLAGLRTPPAAHVYEQIARACAVEPAAIWRGETVDPAPLPGGGPREALRVARDVAETGDYVDAHCLVVTPHGFADILAEILALGLLPFEVADFVPTGRNEAEFVVLLRKASDLSPAERAASVPRLDPRRHRDLPRPGWRTLLAAGLQGRRGA